jgi:large subunit ribosomal protein L37Ae
MAETKKLGSVKRFGARYGRKVKLKLAKIEAVQRGKHRCPYCHAINVKRLSAGIWNCRKCGAKFTGKAYSIKKTIIAEEEPVEKKKKVVEEELEEEVSEAPKKEAKEEA